MQFTTPRFDGAKLREIRQAKEPKLSQSQLGHRIGAHVTSISDWERGANSPSSRHIAGLARELGVPADSFFTSGGDDDDEEDDLVAALQAATAAHAATSALFARLAERRVRERSAA